MERRRQASAGVKARSSALFPNWDPIRRYGVPAPMRGLSGAIKAFALYAGQPVGLIRNLPPVASVVHEPVQAFA